MSSDGKQLEKYQWKPGQSGNPAGKSSPNIRDIIEGLPKTIKDELLKCTLTGQNVTTDQFYAISLLARVGEGDTKALVELGNRLFGKPHQSIDMDLTGQQALKLVQDNSDEIKARAKQLADAICKQLGIPGSDDGGGNGKGLPATHADTETG